LHCQLQIASKIPNRFWDASLVQEAYQNATAVAFHSIYRHKIQTFFTCVEEP